MGSFTMEVRSNGIIDLIPGEYRVYTIYKSEAYREFCNRVVLIVILAVITALICAVVNRTMLSMAAVFFGLSWFCYKLSLWFAKVWKLFNRRFCF